MKDKIMPKFTTSTNAHPSQIVRNAAETVEGWAELVKAIEEHIELYPDVLRPDRELQLARANKKLEEAKADALRACDIWMNEIIKAAE